MLLEKLENEDLEFLELLNNPIAFIECLFSDLDNLILLEEDTFSEVRFYQFPLLSYEYLIDRHTKLNDKDNFKLKENSGSCYCFGGRRYGKTLFIEILDLLLSMVHNNGESCGFSSFDAMHIRGILEKVIQVLENHPFFTIYDARINRSPTYRIFLKNGYCCESINMNLSGENPGGQFFQKHLTRLYIEEASFETEKVYEKRLDSVSENGCVYRIAGMTNFTKYSPAGKAFYDIHRKSLVVNYPQYVNPKWGEAERLKAIREHGGEDSMSYRIFVRGEVVEDGVSAIDMERVRKNYNTKKTIKHIEVSKENFSNLENILIVERPGNAERLFVCADIGEAVTEIVIISEVNTIYNYLYNITVYNLSDKEQYKIFKYLGEKLKANLIGLDVTDGMGRAIYRSLAEVFPKENLCWCGFNEKIKVEIDKDESGNVRMEDGKPVWKEEYVDSWSVKRLRDILYEEGKINLPVDYKFDSQLNQVISTQSGNRTLYTCISSEDHLFAAFRVFAITEWTNYLTIVKNIQKKTFCKSGV
jgi:hypothetical protein